MTHARELEEKINELVLMHARELDDKEAEIKNKAMQNKWLEDENDQHDVSIILSKIFDVYSISGTFINVFYLLFLRQRLKR